jgi:hypothetical protein
VSSKLAKENTMGTTLTPDNIPAPRPSIPPGHDVKSLGPSDSSDSGSDLAGRDVPDDEMTESEIAGGEQIADPEDVAPDRVVEADEAGLGGGLDQAEEARLGITDEELSGDEDSDIRPPRDRRNSGRT